MVGAAVLGVTEAASSTDNGLSDGFFSFALLSIFLRKGRWFPMSAKLGQGAGND